MVYYIESESGIANRFEDYVSRRIKNPYDIEHIWADHYSRHGDEFKTEEEFQNFRNKFGGLLILPRDKNRSYNDNTYVDKLPMYFSENLLARSLNKKCYQNNPQFLNFFKNKSLPFIAHEIFNKNDIVIRQNLYSAICKQIWDVENISRVAR